MSDLRQDVVSRLVAHGLAVKAEGVWNQARIRYWHPDARVEREFLICFPFCPKCGVFWCALMVGGSTFEVTKIFEPCESSPPSETEGLADGT